MLSENALAIYKRLYFDEKQNETTPEQVHKRVADFIANDAIEADKFLEMMNENIFRPNTPCLINAGRKSKNLHDKQLCACFVLGLEDSMDSIIDMWGDCALIYASGAGAGIPITNLRESKSPISTGGTASGPLRYLQVVDLLSDTVRSGGKTRRAANIGVFGYNHPDTMSIINSKKDVINGGLTSFNLSIALDDYFMDCIVDDNLVNRTFSIISPNRDEITGVGQIKNIWDTVVENAWTSGDPGLLFIDVVNDFNPFPSIGKIEATNPCGETPQLPWVVCNLGSINVNCFVKDGSFDWDNFKYYIRLATRFLDRVIDKTTYLNERFEKHTKQIRPIGLGIMGFADALMALELPYGSPDSIEFFQIICSTLTLIAIDESINMAKEYGSLTIPPEDYSHFAKLINYYTNDDHTIQEKFKKFGIRNATWTCIAPTGSISLSADCSYAWEPHFALAWKKPLVDTDQVLTMVLPEFKRQIAAIAFESGMTSKQLMEKVIANNGSLKGIDGVSQHYMDKYRVAHDIDPIEKIKMQGAGQRYISLAISATSNLPNSATKEDISNIFKAAYKHGLKGVTVFRDGCKDSVVQMGRDPSDREKSREVLRKMMDNKKEQIMPVPSETLMMQRPIKRAGETVEINTPYGKLFITCNFNGNSKPFEIFFRVGKQGALTNVLIDALGRVCSKALQSGMHMDHIVETLRGLKGDKFWFKIADDVDQSVEAESIVDAIASIIECHWNKNNIVPMKECVEIHGEECPQCFRKTLRRDTGCRGGSCMACGYSSCG